MKSEIFQLCNLITSIKHALKTKSLIQYESMPYELTVRFEFLPEKEGAKGEVIDGVDDWFARCMYNGLEDVKYMLQPCVDNLARLGFINQANQLMLCFYPDEQVRIWAPVWKYDDVKKGYNITFKESAWPEHPKGKPVYMDNIKEFLVSLDKIVKFSLELGFENWAEFYSRALLMAKGDFDYAADDEKRKRAFEKAGRHMPKTMHLDLPEKNRDMFEAAGAADAFGAMGSWNDEPAGKAAEMNLKDKYEQLSKELYEQMANAIMYAMNEW